MNKEKTFFYVQPTLNFLSTQFVNLHAFSYMWKFFQENRGKNTKKWIDTILKNALKMIREKYIIFLKLTKGGGVF